MNDLTRRLSAGLYGYCDLATGNWYETDPFLIDQSHIDRFAELSGDFFEIHMSEEAAREYGFPGRVAHGILGLALVDGLKNRAEVKLKAVASLGWDWSFDAPVFIGDTIRARISVNAVRPTRTPERGIAQLRFDVTNQHGVTVQSGINKLMMYR